MYKLQSVRAAFQIVAKAKVNGACTDYSSRGPPKHKTFSSIRYLHTASSSAFTLPSSFLFFCLTLGTNKDGQLPELSCCPSVKRAE